MGPFPRGQNRRLRSLRKLDCVAPCPRGQNTADDFAHLWSLSPHHWPLSFTSNSRSAPTKGWKEKRTTWAPDGTTTARKIALAFRISVCTPSTLARGIKPRQSCGSMLQQDGPLGIEVGPAGTKDFIEIRPAPVGEQHYARQCARILVEIGVAGAPDEDEIAGLERAVDFLDRHAGCNEP